VRLLLPDALRPSRSHSLRTQMAVVFGLVVLALSALLSLAYGELLVLRIQRDTGLRLQVVAENAGKLLARGLFERSREVRVLADSPELWTRGLDAPGVMQLLARSQAAHPNSLWIGVADTEGVVRAATHDILVGQSVRSRPWFQAGVQGLHVGDVHPAVLLNKLLPPTPSGEPHRFVDFASPIRLGAVTVGVLGIHGSWEWARDVVQGMLPANAAATALQVFIFDRTGQLIYAPDGRTEALRASGQRMPQDVAVAGPDGPGVSVVPWQDGARYLTAAAPLRPLHPAGDLGWRIVARMPERMAFAEADQVLRQSLLMGLVAALGAALVAWHAAGRLSRDLNVLARAASELEEARPGATIPQATSSREVRRLSSALGRMTHRLLAANEAMEEEVRQRTLALEAANRELDLLARSDPLTGLLNRRGHDAQLAFALSLARRSGRPLALLSLDVDHFKRINDTYGHEAGDQVLRRLAQTLRQRARASDVVARLGGEEFVVLLPDTDLAGARAIAEELLQAVAAQHDPMVGRVTISAGLTVLAGGEDDGPAMLRRADAALYAAKMQGRNRVCVPA